MESSVARLISMRLCRQQMQKWRGMRSKEPIRLHCDGLARGATRSPGEGPARGGGITQLNDRAVVPKSKIICPIRSN